LFQPALEAAATVQPIALRYLDSAGKHSDAAGFVGETSLLESVWTIVSAKHIVAELDFLAPIATHGQTRRALAQRTEAVIAAALAVPAPGPSRSRRTESETDADPPDE
jgi:1-acyl-sn-glycerol-3-phosphate acyltransferase